MRKLICRFFWITIALTPIACAGTSQFKDAVVSEVDDQPCFATSDVTAMRNLQAVVVYDQSTAPPTSTWTVLMDPKREPPSATGCVRYGQKFESQNPAQSAAKLRIGQAYEVYLNAPPTDPSDPTRGYRAQFCLALEAGSTKTKVRQISWDKQLNKWSYEVCGRPEKVKP
jgi:hypothetical protein